MNFKTKRRYKFLLRFFLVLFISSALITLASCYYSLNSGTISNEQLGHLIPFYILGIVIMLISMIQHFRFLNKREDYLRSIKRSRQENWQKIIVELADNGELDKAMALYGTLTFKDPSINQVDSIIKNHHKTYLEGYLTALDKNKN